MKHTGVFLCLLFVFSTPMVVISSTEAFERSSIAILYEGENSLKIACVNDNALAFEYEYSNKKREQSIWFSPMVQTNSFEKCQLSQRDNVVESATLLLEYQSNLCFSVTDKITSKRLAKICPSNLSNPWKELKIDSSIKENIYGLGQYFDNPGETDGDWKNRAWDPLMHTMGNAIRPFSGGMTGYTMFPILYALGTGLEGYALFFDSVYKQYWKFDSSIWSVGTSDNQLRGIVFRGDDIKELRSYYMKLTGKPPVPPKAAFGLWVSKFGYSDWHEVYTEVESLKDHNFPLSGMVLDLQWFGGKFYTAADEPKTSKMGKLEFDPEKFPHPKEVIEDLKKQMGVQLMLIEESYVSETLPEFENLAQQGLLAHYCDSKKPIVLQQNNWWGVGGMIDWTHPFARRYWHTQKRQPLVDMGINFHWTDLGEPEMYDANACYFGLPEINKNKHKDIHNIFNLKWSQGIQEGYQANENKNRHFILSRSGTSGIQKYGAAMWSGDIGSNFASLASYYKNQIHMSLSGIDYYGSDIGGFHRNGNEGIYDLYTAWFAGSALLDVPVRPHVWAYDNDNTASPVLMGHEASNLANIKLRYRLSPYYYALAHQAHHLGTPVIRPMVYEFQEDLNVRTMGSQKMIGPYLMAAVVTGPLQFHKSIYLPKEDWFDWHAKRLIHGQGKEVYNISLWKNDVFSLPLFAREGATIPMSEDFIDINNKSLIKNLDLFVFPKEEKSQFLITDDDGYTIDYLSNKIATTLVTHSIEEDNRIKLDIHETRGEKERLFNLQKIQIVIPSSPTKVILDQEIIPLCQDIKKIKNSHPCFQKVGSNLIEVYLKGKSTHAHHQILVELL